MLLIVGVKLTLHVSFSQCSEFSISFPWLPNVISSSLWSSKSNLSSSSWLLWFMFKSLSFNILLLWWDSNDLDTSPPAVVEDIIFVSLFLFGPEFKFEFLDAWGELPSRSSFSPEEVEDEFWDEVILLSPPFHGMIIVLNHFLLALESKSWI